MTFSKLTDDELDQKVGDYILQHGATSGQVYISGYLRSLGLRVHRRRVRGCIAWLDPQNSALRWGVLVSPKSIPGTMAKFIVASRWKLVIHGCKDGFSSQIMHLLCHSNHLAGTVLNLFLDTKKNW